MIIFCATRWQQSSSLIFMSFEFLYEVQKYESNEATHPGHDNHQSRGGMVRTKVLLAAMQKRCKGKGK